MMPAVGFAQVFQHFTEREGAPLTATLNITQDHQGFMWFATTTGLYRYDSRTFKRYANDPSNPGSIPSDIVQSVFCDSKGNLWVGTWNGLSLYNREEDRFTTFRHDSADHSSPSANVIYCMAEDSDKKLWIGTSAGVDLVRYQGNKYVFQQMLPREFTGRSRRIRCMGTGKDDVLWLGTYDGMFRFETGRKRFRLYKRKSDEKYHIANEYVAVYVDSSGKVWLGSNDKGLICFDQQSERFHILDNFRKKDGQIPNVSGIVPDANGVFWVITGAGLASFDPATGKTRWFVNNPANPYSLPDNVLYSMCFDRQGGLWLGSYYLGIAYCNLKSPDFILWPPKAQVTNCWMGISKSAEYWFINYERNQIRIFDKDGNQIRSAALHLPFPTTYDAFYLDQDQQLWCGSTDVLNCVDLKTGRLRTYPFITSAGENLRSGRTLFIDEGGTGGLWVGGVGGLTRFDKKEGLFHNIPSVLAARTIFQDSKHNVWVGGDDKVFLGKPGREEFEVVPVRISLPSGKTNQIHRIIEDPSGMIWCAGTGGLFVYKPEKKRFDPFIGKGNMVFDQVLDIQSDKNGYLWINGETKLFRYHPAKSNLQAFSYQDGLPVNSILQFGATQKDRDGFLYFVSNNAMFRIDPGKVTRNDSPSPLTFVELRLFNRPVSSGDETGILPRSVGLMEQITFRHDQNVFSLDFALLNYLRSDRNRYSYKLEGFDRQWNETRVPSVTYTSLPPGKYTFLVKAANGDGFWNVRPIKLGIVILPPWWQTWYAYTFYFLVLTVAVYGVTRFFWLRASFRKENALSQAKLDFFTNISHEIRTHLSLISGPLEKAFLHSTQGKNVDNYLAYARDNSDRLMLLVNELLDFRKIQSGNVRLQVREHDVGKIIKSVLAAFEHIAKEKHIETSLLCPDTPILLWFDIAQMQKVFYNLLGNAFKFTPEGGRVEVHITQTPDKVAITLQDNGSGISDEHLQKLFNYYYQADSEKPGYGIGLALSKSIIEQHHGLLTAESRLASESASGMTTLTIKMFRENKHFSPEQIAVNSGGYADIVIPEKIAMPAIINAAVSKQRNTILIVEDNGQLRVFLRELFEVQYNILEAENGLQGLELANARIPDIILSDVMMPEMSGLDLCNKLKTSAETSHIPIVLLTAKTQSEQIIEGLTAGADDYLAKPFNPRILELKIDNLIRVRDELKKSFRQLALEGQEAENSIAENVNEAFIAKLRTLVQENISNRDFGVNELAGHVGMSLSVLYRKMRALTGLTINEFVKAIRLNVAKELLESGVYNVSEVAAMVGFEDAKYFSKEFRKVFGKNPNEVKKTLS